MITSKKFSNHDEWLELRRHSIGGSDAASIVGLNKFSSPYMVWLDKRGELKPFEGNEATRQGSDLEEYVAKRFTEQEGKRVRRRNVTLFNDKYPWAHANVDRWIVGENAGLECKTTKSLNLKQFKEGNYPPQYYIQCLHYMAVTGADHYYLAVLVWGEGFFVFRIDRDEEAIENLMTLEKEFWEEYVQKELPPPVDGSTATSEGLSLHFNDPKEGVVDLMGYIPEIEELIQIKDQIKELSNAKRLLEQELQSYLGNETTGETEGYRVTWKPYKTKSFNKKQLMEDHPEIDFTKYFTEKQSRRFNVKELKK